MPWKNIGDIDPKRGALLFSGAELERDGLTASVIQTISESTVGGDPNRILMRRGQTWLRGGDFISALETVGARLEADGPGMENEYIVRPGHHGEDERIPLRSDAGIEELFNAAYAFGGMSKINIERSVQIGEGDNAPGVLTRSPTIYPEETDIWSILQRELRVSHLEQAEGRPEARPVSVEEDPSP